MKARIKKVLHAVLSLSFANRVLTSRPGVFVRNTVRVHAKAIAGFLAPLLAAQIASRVGFPVPLPIVQQLIAAAIVALSVWLPTNKPKLPAPR